MLSKKGNTHEASNELAICGLMCRPQLILIHTSLSISGIAHFTGFSGVFDYSNANVYFRSYSCMSKFMSKFCKLASRNK